jgi:glycosyltransferase involved in cell wall biosynthesis
MTRLFINFLAASTGGGLTYMRNVIPHLAARSDVKVTVALSPKVEEEFRVYGNVKTVALEAPATRRVWFEQVKLPPMIRESGADVLISAGNFALRKSPVPQILLSRNSLYTSVDFYRDLLSRGEYRFWLDTRLKGLLAQKSIHWADSTVAPSEAFAVELRRWTGVPVCTIHHGFDHEAFCRDSTPLAPEVEEKLRGAEECIKLLFVSHYNYYRNFETLIRALPLLRDRLPERKFRLLLTCKLAAGKNPGPYNCEAAAKLVKECGVSEMLIELGTVPYAQLHQLYRRADIYVTPAYTETFAHPLVEAMSSGLPVVASDLPVHKEICGDAAVYFPRFSAEDLASRIVDVVSSPGDAARLSANGVVRSKLFSWDRHVSELVELSNSLAGRSAIKR